MAFVDTATPDIYATTANLYEIPAGADPLKYCDMVKMNQLRVGALEMQGWLRGVPTGIAANSHYLALAPGQSAALSITDGMRLRNNLGALQMSYNGGAYAAVGSTYTGSLGVSLVGSDFRFNLAYAPTWTGLHTFNGPGPRITIGDGTGYTPDTELRLGATAILTGANGANLLVTGNGKLNPLQLASLSQAIGDIYQADATSSMARLAAVATGNALISGGVGTASAWGKVGLTTHVSGTLAAANGGTGFGSGGYVAGDMLVASGASALGLLSIGTNGHVLTMVAGMPAWSAAGGGSGTVTSVTATNASITIGGTPTVAPTVGINLANANIWSVLQSFGAGVDLRNGAAIASLSAISADVIQLGYTSGTPVAQTLRGTAGTGTNVGGGSLRLAAGPGSGDGASGAVEVWQHASLQGSGTTARALLKTWEFAVPGLYDGSNIQGDLLPAGNGTQSLGSTTNRLEDGWFAGALSVGSFSSTLLGPSGSAALPAFSFSGDANTGLWSEAADQLGVSIGGTARHKFEATRISSKFGSAAYQTTFTGLSMASSTECVANMVSTTAGNYAGARMTNDVNVHLDLITWGSTFGGTFLGVTQNSLAMVKGNGGALAVGTSGANNLTLGTNNIGRLQIGTDAEAADLTTIYVSVNSAWFRVKVGAAGSGSIAAHRMLQIPN